MVVVQQRYWLLRRGVMQGGLYGVVEQNKFITDRTSNKGKGFRRRNLKNLERGSWNSKNNQDICMSRRTSSWHQCVASEGSTTLSERRMQHPNHSLIDRRAVNTPWGVKIAPGNTPETLSRLWKHGFVVGLSDIIVPT
jgi:hypothetical protein